MSAAEFLLVFAVSAAVLALWFVARFPWLVPSSLRSLIVHTVLSCVLAGIATPVALERFEAAFGRLGILVALVAIALPLLTYALTVVLWVALFVRNAGSGALR